LINFKNFLDAYLGPASRSGRPVRIIEIGSQDVNGSLRSVLPANVEYIGVDFVPGKGVDVILKDPYCLPFEDESADFLVSSSCFEHSEMFWLLFLEIMRVTRPDGLFYLNSPANGEFHRYPVDCWRFYPDSGRALATWARRNGLNTCVLESYISTQYQDQWNDFVAIFLKDEQHLARYPARILHTKKDFYNGSVHQASDFLNLSVMPEDKVKLQVIKQIIANEIKVI
jgi:SAM-dependent methyltransferase